ncbi:MAG: hypothetical protein ACTSQP_14290 [Promethearchaeota archaeon]
MVEYNPIISLPQKEFLHGFIMEGRNPYRSKISFKPRVLDEFFTLRCEDGIITVCIDDWVIAEGTVKLGDIECGDSRLYKLKDADDLIEMFSEMPPDITVKTYPMEIEFLMAYKILKEWIRYNYHPYIIHSSL